MPHRHRELRLVTPGGAEPIFAQQERITAVAHEARQKMCANVLNAQLIADHLARAVPDEAAIALLLERIVRASRLADAKLSEIQALTLERPAGLVPLAEGLRQAR